MSRRYVIEVDQPHWDDGNWEYLEEELLSTVCNEVPSDRYSFQIYQDYTIEGFQK